MINLSCTPSTVPSTKRFAFNVIMNWVAMAVGMVVPFFLTPIVVRTLGPTAYGVWILAVSTVAYLNLLDLGSAQRGHPFCLQGRRPGKSDEAKSAIAAALWFRLLIAGGVAVFSIALASVFPRLFNVPADLQRAAQITVLVCALGVAVTLVSGVFGAVLAAINRYDILSCVEVFRVVARATGVILILKNGGGLIAFAFCEFAVIFISGLGSCIDGPEDLSALQGPAWPSRRQDSSNDLVVQLCDVHHHDRWTGHLQHRNLVVGSFLSVGLVSFYSIGGSLMFYSSQVVTALSTTFIPLASGLDASGRKERPAKLLLRGTQATLALVLPIGLTLLLRGKTFIGLWMGRQYSEVSGTVLQILLITLVLYDRQ